MALDKAWWELYVEDREKSAGGSGSSGATTAWRFEKRGVFSIGIIPVVPFITGRRIGRRWFFHPAMRDAADTQVELYREESGLNHVTSLAAFPMIAANGISPERDAEGKVKAGSLARTEPDGDPLRANVGRRQIRFVANPSTFRRRDEFPHDEG